LLPALRAARLDPMAVLRDECAEYAKTYDLMPSSPAAVNVSRWPFQHAR
jgi:hypothetical protein